MPKVEKAHGLKGAKKANLDTFLEAAKKRAEELGIKSVIVASTGGKSGLKQRKCLEAIIL